MASFPSHQPLLQSFRYSEFIFWICVQFTRVGQCQYQDGHMSPATHPGLYICIQFTRVSQCQYQDGHMSPAIPPALYICIQVTRLGWFSEWRWPRHTYHQPLLQAFIYVFRSLGWVDFLYEDGHVSPTTPPGLYICTLVTRVGRYIMMGTCQEPLLQAFLYVPQSLGWVDFGIKMAIYVTSHSSRPLHICTLGLGDISHILSYRPSAGQMTT